MINTIQKYFPDLSEKQRRQFEVLMKLYPEWNSKINVISRKDINNLEVHHILHSLAIAKFLKISPGSAVLDLGTGGGFPGIPLAIIFPEVKFHLVDRIGKKLKVAEEIAKAAELENVTFQHGDIGECKEKFDFVISRAVMPQPELIKVVRKNISSNQRNGMPNGLIALKGGELHDEIESVASRTETVELSNYFDEPFFITKKLVYTII